MVFPIKNINWSWLTCLHSGTRVQDKRPLFFLIIQSGEMYYFKWPKKNEVVWVVYGPWRGIRISCPILRVVVTIINNHCRLWSVSWYNKWEGTSSCIKLLHQCLSFRIEKIWLVVKQRRFWNKEVPKIK